MGNKVIVDKIQGGENCPSAKKYDLEDMITKQYLSTMFDKFTSETGKYHDKYQDLKDIFDDIAKQVNNNRNPDVPNWKSKLINEMNQIATAGFCNPDFLEQQLKEHSKNFNIFFYQNDTSELYSRDQFLKTFLIYCYIKPYYSDEDGAKEDFLKKLADTMKSKLENPDNDDPSSLFADQTQTMVHWFGLVFSLEVMKVYKTQKPDLLEKTLLHIHTSMLQIQTGRLKRSFYEYLSTTEEILNNLRDFLVECAIDESCEKPIRDLSVKIIILIGNLRESGEDFLIAFNLIKDYQIDVNLRNELGIITESQGIDDENADSDFKMITEDSDSIHMISSSYTIPYTQDYSSIVFDENFAYISSESKGLFKVGMRNTLTSKKGLTYVYSTSNTNIRSIVHINGKLYIRDNKDMDNPIQIIDKDSLEIVKDENFKKLIVEKRRNENDDPWNLSIYEITSQTAFNFIMEKGLPEPQRRMDDTGIFTEGKYIYIVATYYDKNEVDHYEVEVYDPETLNHVKSIKLVLEPDIESILDSKKIQTINDDTEFLKNHMTNTSKGRVNFMTNGSVLVINVSSKLFFFSMKTGERSPTVLNITGTYACYNYYTNTFYSFYDQPPVLNSFKIEGFLEPNSDETKSGKFEKFYKSRVKEMQSKLDSSITNIKKNTVANLLDSLLKSKNDYAENKEITKTAQAIDLPTTLFAILNKINSGNKEASDNVKGFDAWDQSIADVRHSLQTMMYRSKFSTSVGFQFFKELTTSLKGFQNLLDGELTQENILDQYQFAILIELVSVSLQIIKRLSINIKNILQDVKEYEDFINVLESTSTKILMISDNLDQFKDKPSEVELVKVWEHLANSASTVQLELLSVASDSEDDLLSKIDNIITSFKQDDFKSSHGVFLGYLANTSTLESISKSDSFKSIFSKLLEMFEVLADKKTNKLVRHIKHIEFNKGYKNLEYDSFEDASEVFMRAIAQRVLVINYKPYPAIYKARSDGNKKVEQELLKQVSENRAYYSIVFNKISESVTKVLTTCDYVTRFISIKCKNMLKKEKPLKEGEISEAVNIYSQFHKHLMEIAVKHNKFLDYMHIYVAAIASDKSLEINESVFNMCQNLTKVLEWFTKYCDAETHEIKVDDNTKPMSEVLGEDLMRFFTWTLSKISYSLILTKFEDNEVHKKLKKLLDSQLLSGGLELKHIHTFNEETKTSIMSMADVLQDKNLIDMIDKKDIDEQEKYLQAVLNLEKMPEIESTIELLHWNYERSLKEDETQEYNSDEIMAIRGVFASSIKLSDLVENFIQISDFVGEVQDDTKTGNEKYEALLNDVKDMPNFRKINRMWAYSTGIKTWYSEQTKKIDDEYEQKSKEKKEKESKQDENKEDDKKEDNKEDQKDEDNKEEDNKDKDDNEETIDTTKGTNEEKQDSKPKPSIDDKLLKNVQNAKEKLLKGFIDKAELLTKFCSPKTWSLHEKAHVEVGEMIKSKSKQSMVFKKTHKKKHHHERPNDCEYIVSWIFPFFETEFTSQEMSERVEAVFLSGIKRHVGFKLMQEVINSHSSSETLVHNLTMFWSALRKGVNKIVTYSDRLNGAGHYIKQNLQKSFFNVFTQIIKKLTTADQLVIPFIFSCLKWDFDIEDFVIFAKTNYFKILCDGNENSERARNIIKYQWGHKINYQNYEVTYSLSHLLTDSLEYMASMILTKLIGKHSKHRYLTKHENKQADEEHHESIPDPTSLVIKQFLDLIFIQLNRYSQIITKFDPIDWKLFVKKSNSQREKGNQIEIPEQEYLIDELTPEEAEKELQEELKAQEQLENQRQEEAKREGAQPRDMINEIIEDDTKKELKKASKMYDDLVVVKLLRLVEVFTNIAQDNHTIKNYAKNLISQETISFLLKLLTICQSKHGLIITKILTNLINIGVNHETFDHAAETIKDIPVVENVMNLEVKCKFENWKFLEFCYKLCYYASCTSSSDSDDLKNTGHYSVVTSLKQVFHSILRSHKVKVWKHAIESELDIFMTHAEAYAIEEFDIMTSLLEGGDFLGLGVGNHGITNDKKLITIIGFVERWYDLNPPGKDANQDFILHKISYEYKSKDHFILGMTYDKEHPKKSTLGIFKPEDITLIPNLELESSDYLLSKDRLQTFFDTFKIDKTPDKTDSVSLSQRCVGMKILVNQIETNGEKLAEIIDPAFKNKLIEQLLIECTSSSNHENMLKCEHLEQKLYALKKLALEKNIPLVKQRSITISFKGKRLCISKSLQISHQEVYNEVFELLSGMNYGKVEPSVQYKVIPETELYENTNYQDTIAVLDSSELSTADKIIEVFKHCEIVVSSNLDLKKMHDQLKEKDKNSAFFKTIVLVSNTNLEKLRQIINIDPAVKIASDDEMSLNDAFISELTTFCKVSKSEVEKALKGNEEATFELKVSSVIKYFETKKNDKENKQDDTEEVKEQVQETTEIVNKAEKTETSDDVKKENKQSKELRIEDDPMYCYGCDNSSHLDSLVNQLASFEDNNFVPVNNQSKDAAIDLFEKVYSLNHETVLVDYMKTLADFYKELCRKTVSSFFEGLSIDSMFDFIFKSEENKNRFIKYILIKGSDAVSSYSTTQDESYLDDFWKIIESMVSSCSKDPKYMKLLETFYTESIINNTKDIFVENIKEKLEVKTIYDKQKNASKSLNVFLTIRVLNLYKKYMPDFIYQHHQDFANLMSVLFLIPVLYRNELDLQKQVYIFIYRTLVPIAKNPENYNIDLRIGLLRLKIFKMMIEKCNFSRIAWGGNEKLSVEQKLLFEIFSLIHSIDSNMVDYWSLYTYTDTLWELEKCAVILREGKEFDMISYLIYFNNELSGPQQHTKVYADTFHSMFEGKISCKVQFEGFKKMTFRLDDVSKIEDDKLLAVSTDPDGESIIKTISQKDIEKGSTSCDIYFNQWYIHYPFKPIKIVGFGEGGNYRLGNGNTANTDGMTDFQDFMKPVDWIAMGDDFTAVLDTSGNLYYAGYKGTLGDTNQTMKKYTKKMPEEKVVKILASKNNLLLVTEDEKIYVEGYDYRYHIKDYSTSQYDFIQKKRPNEAEEKIVDIDIGLHFHLYVTDNGNLYAAGQEFTCAFDIYRDANEYVKIELEEGVIPKKVRCATNSETPKVALLFIEKDGKSELWSAGNSGSGMLGQKEDVSESKSFKPLDYDMENITFVDAKASDYHCLALTDKGELYGWGSNSSKKLGMQDEKTYYSPTKIPFFEEYVVHSIHVGNDFSVVEASKKEEPATKMVFSLGNVWGINSESKNDDGILHIQELDNAEYKQMMVYYRSVIFVYDGEVTASETTGIHHGYTWDVTEQCPIVGTMHFYKDNDNKWHFLSKQGYEQVKSDLPPVSFVTKWYIEDIQGKEWPEVDHAQVLEETKEEWEPEYVSWITVDNESMFPRPRSTENYIFEREDHDINPIIFYRLSRPLKEDAKLPEFDLTKYHKRTELFGIRVEADPDYSFQKNDIIMNLEYEKYANIQNRTRNFNSDLDEEIQRVLEDFMKTNSVDFIECPFLFVMASDFEWNDQAIRALPTDLLQQRMDTLVLFNQHFLKIIPFTLGEEQLTYDDSESEIKLQSQSISASFILGKKYAFDSVKSSYVKKIADQLQTNGDCPTVNIKRSAIKKRYDEGIPDTKGEWTMFALITRKLKEKNYEYFKQNTSNCQPFRANFEIEGLDDSGSTRKALSSISEELHSSILTLFVPSMNNKLKKGEFQDGWMINPTCTGPAMLEMYKCLGAIIGHAFRCGNCIDLKLTPLFWKKLLCEPLEIDDLEKCDLEFVESLKELKKQKEGKPEDFKDPGLKFTTTLSDGSVVELCQDGQDKPVTYDNIEEYVNLVLSKRYTESNKQMEWINKGFDIIFPADAMKVMKWEDVETRVRGQEVTISKLKEITTYYSMSVDDEWGLRFWETLEKFSQEELQRYLRYIVGRTRLPYEDKVKDLMHYLNLKDNYYNSDHDDIFPDIYTYNFQMYFPRYSTSEIAKKKILEDIERSEKYYIYGKGDGAEDQQVEEEESDSSESDEEENQQNEPEAPNAEAPGAAPRESSIDMGDIFGGDDDY